MILSYGNRIEIGLFQAEKIFSAPIRASLKSGGETVMYAIIVTGGKQYKVSEGDILFIEKKEAQEGAAIKFEEVIAVSNDGEFTVNPSGASVDATVIGHGKDKKIIVYKYKPKKGYHKKQGHRQPYTKVKIEKINL